MRTTFTLLAFAGAALCQELSSLPPCAQTCVTDMISIAQSEFGCKADDVGCYCGKAEFGYGVRDCSNEACSAEDAAKAIEYGTKYCAGAISSEVASSGAVPILSSAASSAASATGGDGGASGTPITTEALIGTVTSDGSTYETTTGFSTVFGGASSAVASATDSAGSAITSAASSASDAASSAASDASSVASSAASSAESAASSAASEASSIAGSATSAVESAASSAADTGNAAAPMKTAFPMAGALGMAAFLLI